MVQCTPLEPPRTGSEMLMHAVGSTAPECGEDGDSDEEEARFEDDTESFMLREREFNFPGLPPGAPCSFYAPQGDREIERPRALARKL